MAIRNITDPAGSFTTSSEVANNQEAVSRDPVDGGAAQTVNQDGARAARQNAEAFTLSADFGSGDPAEVAKRSQRVQELKAQNEAGTLKPADSRLVATKLIQELLI